MHINRTNTICSRIIGTFAGVSPLKRGGVSASAPRPAAMVRPFSAVVNQQLKWLWTALLLVCLAPIQCISAQSGSQFINRAELHTAESPPQISKVAVTLKQQRTPSTIEFLKYAPGVAGAVTTTVPGTYYLDASGSYLPLGSPLVAGTGVPIDISAPVPLLPTALFHSGEPIFIKVTDLDQNLNSTTAETFIITITDPVTGDLETLRLTENGTDTGIFIGYIQSSAATTVTANGALTVITASYISAQYIDPVDGTDSSTTAALIDPYGLVFDTTTGLPVNGAKVELLNADGTPATVYGDNGKTTNIFPNSVISGGTATDAEGNSYSFTPGGYRFPYVNLGDYILKVTPPASYSWPSTVSTETIQTLPGAPFTIVLPGSHGEQFSVPIGPAIHIDIPLDPQAGSIWLKKSASKDVVSPGEFLSYKITLENNNPVATVYSTVVTDILPPGFRYQKGSTRINTKPAVDPSISSDGRTMTFTVGDVVPGSYLNIHYVVSVGAGAKQGSAINTAIASATPSVAVNKATATVTVTEPFLTSRNIIMGRVIVGSCTENIDDNKKGMGGVGIYLEDGTFVFSDKFGMFHFEGVKSGTHVVQLDLDSIPEGYKILPCEQNSRFAGRAYSQFVDLHGGAMWRADFYLSRAELTPPLATAASEKTVAAGMGTETVSTENFKGEISLEMISSQSGEFIDYHIPLQSATVPLTNLQLEITLPPGAIYVNDSSKLDGTVTTEPVITEGKLRYELGSAGADWHKELSFRVAIDLKAKGGELLTKGLLTFDTASAKGVAAPSVNNILSLVKEENDFALPPIVVRPEFPTFEAELSEADRKKLDDMALHLSGLKIDRIDVTGHTDIVRIAPRSRHIYADNNALSFARAKSVGRYLTAALHLPPEKLYLSGSGEKAPLASNKTAAGRALNRRVEVKVSAVQTVATNQLKIIKERSGQKRQETSSGPPSQKSYAPDILTPLRPINEKVMAISADSASESIISETAQKPETAPLQSSTGSAAIKDSPAPLSERVQEGIELFSALNDGIVHYRLKLVGSKDNLKNVTATFVTPKNFLYLTDTSRLSGVTVEDPAAEESLIRYSFAPVPDEKRFDLRLQALLDGDDQSLALESSVTVVLTDADGKNQKTYTATSLLSDSMEEINRPEVKVASAEEIIAQENRAYAEEALKEAERSAAAALEFIETAPLKISDKQVNDPNIVTAMRIDEAEGIHSPVDGDVLAVQIHAVRIVINSELTPQLLLDGKEIPADRIGFSMKDPQTKKSLYTYIGVDFGDPGQHSLQLKGLDSFGIARFDKTTNITRAGAITAIRLISADGNIADGKTPIKMRVQLLDQDYTPVHAYAELSVKGGELKSLTNGGISSTVSNASTVSVSNDGWIYFQPVATSGLYKTQLSYNSAVLDVETYVKPKMRDWIIVGLGEGTVGYNTVSGNMESLKASDQQEDLYDKERLALFAKGTIKGEWLLTMAYDSAKKSTGVSGRNALFQTIDPNSYYTIYGDGSSQMYDAASQKKLYLKIERDQFYALLGDYDTGLSVSELSRYSRKMTGIKSEYRSKDYDVTVFGSETDQSFVKDEFRGDGTSGLYRLSRKGIVLNSEKITIESRDRFHSETIINSVRLNPFIDYSIDYETGAIFFKGPVASRDENFNPVYIVVDYEIRNTGTEALTYGGRAATRLMNGKVEVGGTFVNEGQVSGSNKLYGVDAAALIAPGTKVRAEFATTDNQVGLNQTGNANYSSTTNGNTEVNQKANAYLAEITHTGKRFDAKAYFREQENGFGLGQQSNSESGTRKFGTDAGYRLNENVTLSSQAYRQYNLADDKVRDFIETLAIYNEKQYTLRSGLRYANDKLEDGGNETSVQATVGGIWRTKDQRLTLRTDHAQSLFSNNDNSDFPTRTIVGADYQVTKATTVFAQEELTYGAAEDTNTTRVGVKTTPWSGGAINSSVVNDMRENSERTFANVGLTQRWQLNPRWAVDGGLERTETVRKKERYTLDADVPAASGGEDFTAVSLGANYTEKKLTWSNRVEYRNSDTDDKWGIISGIINEQGLNWGWTGRLQLLHTESVGGNKTTNADLRLGLAYRPPVTRWIILDRLDLVTSDTRSATSSLTGKRLVNNLNANYKPDKQTQISIQYGAKYVLEEIDDKDYSGFTDLIGLEGRYDINKEWDLGLRSSLLHTWSSGQYAYSFGPSVGYNVMENAWISLGYNFAGFTDRDFSAANYTAQGPYIHFRFKFDQNSVKDGLKMLGQ